MSALVAPLAATPLYVPPSVVLDGCAFSTMFAALYPLVSHGFADARRRSFALACMTHLVASALALIHGLVAGGGGSGAGAPASGLVTSAVLDAVSLVFLILAMTMHGKEFDRRGMSHTLVCGMALAVLPSALALATMPWHGSPAGARFAYALTLTMFLSVFATARDRDLAARETEVALRQSSALADQMRPHFIFNALSTIQGLCYEEPEAAAMQVEQFSDYLRGHIDALSAVGLVPFETEVGHAREYASLCRAGSSTSFELIWDLRETAFMVPPLTVQPIVENAIRYGALGRSDGRGEVRVTSERRGGFARVVIQDNGPGMKTRGRQNGDRRGIGLANAEERLRVQCDGSLTVSTNAQGTRVVLVIPLDRAAWRAKTAESGKAPHRKAPRKEGASK